jgi:outer membrane protein insertion porin family
MHRVLTLAVYLHLLPALLPAQAADGRIYVRNIEFVGAHHVDDEVLRRELTQFEGAHVNTVALEQSRLRLERLPYVARAELSQRPVADVPDQVDVVFTITEAPAGEYRLGGAWSESIGFSGFAYVVNENLAGTGQRLYGRIEASELHTSAQVSHTAHHVLANGVSRTLGLGLRNFDRLTADTTELDGDSFSVETAYSYRIAERQAVRLGLELRKTKLATGERTSSQLEAWLRNNGNPEHLGNALTTDYAVADFLFGWHHDTRDRHLFPTVGLEQEATLRVAVPGSEVESYTLEYGLTRYWSLAEGWTGKLAATLAYGAKYGAGTSSLPPHLNWFAGGPDSVRGYRENRLGPRDSLGNPYGGNLLVAARFELSVPLPAKWDEHMRLAFFYDAGNVFSTEDVRFEDDEGRSLDYAFRFAALRHSAGVAADIALPLGLLRLSYGVPLNADTGNGSRFLDDDVERFQVAIGVAF